MKVFVELWRARDSWVELSPEQRGEWMQNVGPSIQAMLGAGVAYLGGGRSEAGDQYRATTHDFFAVWTVRDDNVLRMFESAIEQSGWYDYFEQVNVTGESVELESLIGLLIELGASAQHG
jgi:hypothetical protein